MRHNRYFLEGTNPEQVNKDEATGMDVDIILQHFVYHRLIRHGYNFCGKTYIELIPVFFGRR